MSDTPPEWRPTWREPKSRARARAKDAAIEVMDEPLPESGEMRGEALRMLRAISIDPAASDTARVGAAKAILDETAPDVRAHLLRLLKGDRAKLRAWLLAELAELDKAEAGR